MGAGVARRKFQVDDYVFEIAHAAGDIEYQISLYCACCPLKCKHCVACFEKINTAQGQAFLINNKHLVLMSQLIGAFDGLVGMNGAKCPKVMYDA